MHKLISLSVMAVTAGLLSFNAVAGKGNGAPSGAHFNLNIIGTGDKSAAMDGNNGHRIFVKLQGKSKIWLKEGPDFAVLDANATDNNGGAFQLPNPDPDNDGITEYSVYARALGAPGGWSKTTTCAYDELGGEWCSLTSMVLVREKGKSSFDNVSRELLYIYIDLDGDGVVERYPLFDDALEDYFWEYDNHGLRLVQLRFYEIPTDVN